jgi:hypothetical protein
VACLENRSLNQIRFGKKQKHATNLFSFVTVQTACCNTVKAFCQ